MTAITDQPVGWVEPRETHHFAAGRPVQLEEEASRNEIATVPFMPFASSANMMGIAALNPSYGPHQLSKNPPSTVTTLPVM